MPRINLWGIEVKTELVHFDPPESISMMYGKLAPVSFLVHPCAKNLELIFDPMLLSPPPYSTLYMGVSEFLLLLHVF